ncbi:MAG: AAA family ATPase, partial [Lachnospiraceae bacterium]|nr:AAA family ATPase [Lachnospiraceae bacterium]
LREALANCIVNTDFFVSRGIVIRKDDEKIVIENPGYIRTGKDQMLKGGISDPRNKALMKMFNMIGIGERAGSGVPDIFSVWESNGWIPPEIEEQYNPDRTILTLSFKKKSAESAEKSAESADNLSSRHQQILSLMEVGQEYSSDEIAEMIGLKGSRTRQLLKELVDSNYLSVTSGTKNRRYIKK